MLTLFTELNWLAVLASTVLFAVIGTLYFGFAIAKPYAVALGRVGEAAAKPSSLTYAGPVVGGLVMSITSALVLRGLGVTGLGDAIVTGLVIGVGYLAAMTFVIAINPNIPRPLLYGAINAPGFVLWSVLSSILLALWR